jgi:hypothetical protein
VPSNRFCIKMAVQHRETNKISVLGKPCITENQPTPVRVSLVDIGDALCFIGTLLSLQKTLTLLRLLHTKLRMNPDCNVTNFLTPDVEVIGENKSSVSHKVLQIRTVLLLIFAFRLHLPFIPRSDNISSPLESKVSLS